MSLQVGVSADSAPIATPTPPALPEVATGPRGEAPEPEVSVPVQSNKRKREEDSSSPSSQEESSEENSSGSEDEEDDEESKEEKVEIKERPVTTAVTSLSSALSSLVSLSSALSSSSSSTSIPADRMSECGACLDGKYVLCKWSESLYMWCCEKHTPPSSASSSFSSSSSSFSSSSSSTSPLVPPPPPSSLSSPPAESEPIVTDPASPLSQITEDSDLSDITKVAIEDIMSRPGEYVRGIGRNVPSFRTEDAKHAIMSAPHMVAGCEGSVAAKYLYHVLLLGCLKNGADEVVLEEALEKYEGVYKMVKRFKRKTKNPDGQRKPTKGIAHDYFKIRLDEEKKELESLHRMYTKRLISAIPSDIKETVVELERVVARIEQLTSAKKHKTKDKKEKDEEDEESEKKTKREKKSKGEKKNKGEKKKAKTEASRAYE